jgi:hypothetical protein
MMGRYRHDAVTPFSFWLRRSFCIAKHDNMRDRTGYSHVGTYCLTQRKIAPIIFAKPENCLLIAL